jgi:hypothetical protein
MPAKQSRRLHDHQGAAPLEQLRQHDQADTCRSVHPPWPHTSLDKQRQLPAQEQILGAHSLRRTEQQHQPSEGVLDQTKCDPGEGDHALIVPHRSTPSRQIALPRRTQFLRSTGLDQVLALVLALLVAHRLRETRRFDADLLEMEQRQ